VLGAEDYETEVRFSGQNAVFMGVWVLPNANTLDVIKRVRDLACACAKAYLENETTKAAAAQEVK